MTTSYTAGTVSVTAGSDMVTGSGTGWLTANIAPGYFGLDSANGNPVPVAEVISDTSMRLVTPWRGTTASGQAYWLSYDTRDGQQTVNNAQRLAEYIARLNNAFFSAIGALTPMANTFLTFNAAGTAVLSALTSAGSALLGVAGGANKFPYFTGGATAAMADLTPFARTLLDDADAASAYATLGIVPNPQIPVRIRSTPSVVGDLNSITENGWYAAADTASNRPPTVGSYWLVEHITWPDGNHARQRAYDVFGSNVEFGRSKINGSWTSWRSYSSGIVGQTFNSGGSPAGSVIERGSNANGSYIRFADGTQICTGQVTAVNLVASGSLFRSDQAQWVFPVAFANETPSVSGNAQNSDDLWIAATGDVNSSFIRAFYWGAPTTGWIIRTVAIGRWY